MSEADAKPVTNRRRTIDRIVITLLVTALVAQSINLIVQSFVSPLAIVVENGILVLIGWYLYGAGKRAVASTR